MNIHELENLFQNTEKEEEVKYECPYCRITEDIADCCVWKHKKPLLLTENDRDHEVFLTMRSFGFSLEDATRAQLTYWRHEELKSK